MKVNFYLKQPQKSRKEGKDSLISIYCSLYNTRFVLSTGISIPPDKWNTDKQRVKKGYTGHVELNAFLNKLKADAERAFYEDISNPEHSIESVRKQVEHFIPSKNRKKKQNFFEAFDLFLEIKSTERDAKTILKYKALLNHLNNFQKLKGYKITFESINLAFFEQFKAYLIKDLQMTNNTIDKYIQTLKTFLKWCVEREYTNNQKFKKFKTKKEKTIIIYLTRPELLSVYHLDLSDNKTLEKVRDVFCFACFTGQRFSDLKHLKREDIKGKTWHLVTQKTKDIIPVPLVEPALGILKKYQDQEKPLPIFSNQRTNLYIKEVCKLAGIDDFVTKVQYRGAERIEIREPKYQFVGTHVARKTFVTLSQQAGMSDSEIMRITGHDDLKTLQKYSGQNDKVIETKMKEIWGMDKVKLKVS